MRTQDQLPQYLKTYTIEHDTSKYTSRDHAAWRYIMQQALPFFRDHAVKGYEEGLAATGIPLDRIPHIDDMDAALQKFGWGAVPVCGFIPPWAFLEFQARKILPIATDMRSVNHISYTPAPDIVHEAAGHAPILPDEDYNAYLAYYAKLGTKAIYSDQDLSLYEAVRYLSDIKEKPDSSAEDIADAERRLSAAVSSFSYVSEATRVGRMSWWTAEYGLTGDPKLPKIFGAGLLSSIGESLTAVTDKVQKVPLSVDCTNQSFNITEPQPQLFVAEDMKHLHDVLSHLDDELSYRKGGNYGLNKALLSRAVTTTNLDSGLQVSGKLTSYEKDDHGNCCFVKYDGPVQLCHGDNELKDQGVKRHPEGFSAPLGRFQKFQDTPVAKLKEEHLTSLGLSAKEKVKLKMTTGFLIEATYESCIRSGSNIVLMTFSDCRITKDGKLYYDPEWGIFDLAVGERVVGVAGGPADREKYGEHEIPQTETSPGRTNPYSPEEKDLFALYADLRELRESDAGKTQKREKLSQLAKKVSQDFSDEWLIGLEIFDLAKSKLEFDPEDDQAIANIAERLQERADEEAIARGLSMIGNR